MVLSTWIELQIGLETQLGQLLLLSDSIHVSNFCRYDPFFQSSTARFASRASTYKHFGRPFGIDDNPEAIFEWLPGVLLQHCTDEFTMNGNVKIIGSEFSDCIIWAVCLVSTHDSFSSLLPTLEENPQENSLGFFPLYHHRSQPLNARAQVFD